MQLYDIGYASAIVLALIGLSRYRWVSTELRFFALYLTVDVMVTFVQFYFAGLHFNNLWTVHLYLPLQYGFTVWTLSSFVKNERIRNVFRNSIFFFVMVWAVVLIGFETMTQYSRFNKPFATALMILFSLYTLILLNRESSSSLKTHPGFWISSGTLLYCVTVFMLFLLFNQILTISQEMLGKIYQIQALAGISKNIMYAIAFFCVPHGNLSQQGRT
jgi:hypothetical protein